MNRVLVGLILLGALFGVILIGDRPAPRADLVMANGSDVTTLDPQRMSWMPDLRVARLVFEGLVQHDVLDLDFPIRPAAAEAWEVSTDGLEYTFHIRADAKWSNGRAVTSEDFRFSWRRAMLPDLASDYFEMFMFVEGARPFYEWRMDELDRLAAGTSDYTDGAALWEATQAKFDELVELRAPDARTLAVRLERPVPYFLDLCAFAVFDPVYPALVEQYERPDPATGRLIRKAGWTKPGVLVSNGPFELVGWRFKRDMRLEKNPHYWGRDAIALDSISIPSIEDPNAQILAFQTGALDWVADVTAAYRGDMVAAKEAFLAEHAERVAQLRAEGLDQFAIDRALPGDDRKMTHAVSSFGTYFFNFNCKKKLPDGRANPFFDPRVRRAFALVVDKRSITGEVRRLGEPVASTLIPPGSIGGYDGPAGLPNIGDARTQAEKQAIIDRALALLGEAGYPDPANDFPITVELVFNKDSGHDLIAQIIARNWSGYLGVKTRLAQKELKVYRDDLKKKNYITSRAGWYGDYGDPTTFLNLSRTGDGNNDRAYSNPAYDDLLAAADAELDAGKRMALLGEAERMIVEDDLPMIPIFHYATVYMFDPNKLTGLTAHPRVKQNAFEFDILSDGKGDDEPKPMRKSFQREGLEGREEGRPRMDTGDRESDQSSEASEPPISRTDSSLFPTAHPLRVLRDLRVENLLRMEAIA